MLSPTKETNFAFSTKQFRGLRSSEQISDMVRRERVVFSEIMFFTGPITSLCILSLFYLRLTDLEKHREVCFCFSPPNRFILSVLLYSFVVLLHLMTGTGFSF